MKSFAFSLFLFLVLALGCAGTLPDTDYSVKTRSMVRHSLVIQLEAGDEWHNVGSAVAVGKWRQKHVVTARHIGQLAGSYPLRACATLRPDSCVPLNKHRMYGKAITYDIKDDWVKFKVSKYPGGTTSAYLATSKPKIGDSIWIVGAPSGQIGEVTHGIVSNRKDGVLFVDGRILPGNSGGPVYNEDGFLIGLATALKGVSDIGWVPTWGIVVPIQEVDL